MPTTTQNMQSVRLRLGNPDPEKPSDPQLLDIMIEHIADHCAQLQNTRNHWSIYHWRLAVNDGTEDYLIPANDFGRPFLIHTVDDADPYHVPQEIPFSFLQDASQRNLGPQICFYRLAPSTPVWWARLVPVPRAERTYKIWYEADYTFGSLGDAPGLSSFHHLIRVQTALSALPLASWGDLSIRNDREGWGVQAQALRDVLLHDEAIYQKRFDAYKAQSSRDGVNSKLGYAPSYEYDNDGFGVGVLAEYW